MVSSTLIIAGIVFVVFTIGTAYAVMKLAGGNDAGGGARRRHSESKGARDRRRE